MATAISSRRRTKRKQPGDEAVIEHLVRVVYGKKDQQRRILAPFTISGLSVEEQVRKVWQPSICGLAVF